MTKEEFKSWLTDANSRSRGWHIHPIHNCLEQGLLIYRGVDYGSFILIDPDGTAACGRYAFAIPDITEDSFTILSSKKHETPVVACQEIGKACNLAALLIRFS